MSNEENKKLVRQLHELLNAGKHDEADALYAPDALGHSAGQTFDRARSKQNRVNTYAGSPDRQVTLEATVADGDLVVARTTWRGTQTGHLHSITGFEIPPTGKKTTVTGMTMYRIAEGKIAESWGELDRMTLMQQLGVVPGPQPATP
jgi:predicted ester cyclase